MKRVLLFLLCALSLAAAPALAKDKDGVEDWRLAPAKALFEEYEFRAAEKAYAALAGIEELRFRALVGMARCAAGVGEHPRARSLFAEAAELDPARPEPYRGTAYLSLLLDRREEAREWYEKALARVPEDGTSLAGLAKIAIEDGEYETADALSRRALESEPDVPFVRAVRAEWCYRTGDITRATEILRGILTISPNYLSAHLRLANGFLEKEREPYRPPEVPRAYDAEVERGVAAYRALDLEAAERLFAALDTEGAPDGRPAFFRGLVALRRGQVRAAVPHLRRALEKEPGSLLFRNALGEAFRVKIARQRIEYGAGADRVDRVAPVVALLPDPEVPGIGKLVRGYGKLTRREQALLRRTLAPLARFLPRLVRNRVTHDILGYEDRVCDATERRYLFRRRTVDGRAYAGLRGLGGRAAATGIEYVRSAAELRVNTFAHEIMHQVHRFGLSGAERRVVTLLYERAKATDRCLDYYAASNEKEYLAQGYEAFVSLVKSPYHYNLARHTRAELKARDPGLYRFLLRITGTRDPDPELKALAPMAIEFYEWAGDETALARAKALYGPLLHPEAVPGGR
jgi:tetratricopeptide (TPR) repeat protein